MNKAYKVSGSIDNSPEWKDKQRKILSQITSIYIEQGKLISQLFRDLGITQNEFNQLIKCSLKLNLSHISKISEAMTCDFDIVFNGNSEEFIRESS